MDDNENLAWLTAERELRDRKAAKKKPREPSSTDAPPKYWMQGKLFFITNSDHTLFFVKGQGDVGPNREEGHWVTDTFASASTFKTLREVNHVIEEFAEYERKDFERGNVGRWMFKLFQDAQPGVVVFKCRDIRVPTHLQAGDDVKHVHKWVNFMDKADRVIGQRCKCGAQEWF